MYGARWVLWTKEHSRIASLSAQGSLTFQQLAASATMSSPPNGRALPFPVVWGNGREDDLSASGKKERRSASDEELMAWIQTNDHQGLDELYIRYSRLVFGIALHLLNDRSEAEEVVQEVFLAIYQKASQFDPAKGSGKTWLVQIAFSRARDHRSHLARRGFYAGTDIDSLNDTLQGDDNVERQVGLRIDFACLLSAFEGLTQMQRVTLELYYFQGLELREISERLNEPLGNVRHHLYRGLERLRKSPAIKRFKERHHAYQ